MSHSLELLMIHYRRISQNDLDDISAMLQKAIAICDDASPWTELEDGCPEEFRRNPTDSYPGASGNARATMSTVLKRLALMHTADHRLD